MRKLLRERSGRSPIVGGQPWSAEAGAALAAWCTASGIPVAASWRCQDYVDNTGAVLRRPPRPRTRPPLEARLRDADVLLVVGARLGDIETGGYETIVPPGLGRTLIHVHADPDELGRVYEPALGIVASGRRGSPRRSPTSSRSRTPDAAARSGPRTSLSRDARVARRCPARASSTGVMEALAQRLGRRRDHHERRRELHRLGAPLLHLPALPDAARAAVRGDGVRTARRRRREARPPRAGRRVHRGRRRLPDVRAGARDGAPARRAGGRARRRQRHVRDDQDAPGAAVSGAGQRHRAREPRLRGARRRVRLPRRACGAHR